MSMTANPQALLLPTLSALALLLLLQAYPGAAAALEASSIATTDQWSAVAAAHDQTHPAGNSSSSQNATQKLFCRGSTCKAMSNLLPSLQFMPPKKAVRCTCTSFTAGRCFAPGCFVCAKSCFTGDLAFLANAPGPFGTGLLCSSGCLPCCQRVGDASKAVNSTCDLVGPGC